MLKQFVLLDSGYETITFSLESQLFGRFITGARKTDLTNGKTANCAADDEFTPSRALHSYLTFLALARTENCRGTFSNSTCEIMN